MSSASNIDPDIAAAFNNTPPTASSHSNIDPDIASAFASSGQGSSSTNDEVFDPEGAAARAEVGGSQLVASSLANIPHATAHAISDFLTGGKPDSALVNALRVPLGEEGKKVAEGLATAAAPVSTPIKKGINAADTALGNFSPTLQDVVHNTARVGGDVLNILPLTGIVKGLAFPREITEEAAPTAESVVSQASSGQSMGAAATAPNVSQTSAPLKEVIANADPNKIDPVALKNHIEADQHGIQLTKGQATRDPTQFSQEQNSTHPDIVARLNQQNDQMVNAIDDIRREASPTNVSNSPRENGQIVLDDLKAYDEPIKADISAKYKSLAAANGGDLPVDGASFKQAADTALARENKARYLPTEVRQTLEDIQKNGEFSYNQFEGLRTDLAAAGRKADKASDGNAKAAINITRQALEQLPMTPKFNSNTLEMADPSGIKVLADQARSAAKERFDALESDPAYEAAVNDSVTKGKPSPLADTFLDDYVLGRGAPKQQVDLMMQKLGEEGQGAVASHTLSAIRKGAVNASGNVLPNGYNTAMAKYADKLPSLVTPEVNDSLQSLGRTITNAKVAPPGSFVNYSKSGVVANAAQGLGEAALNAKTMGMGVPILKGMIKSRFAKDALAPGAGIER